MSELPKRWRQLTEELGAPAKVAASWGRRLAWAYSNPLRAYHSSDHVLFLLSEIDRHTNAIEDPVRLKLTAFFHDFIYRTWRKDNEARSADAASTALASLGAQHVLIDRVHRLIVWTADHSAPPEADGDDVLFLDMDLAVLGAEPDVYDRYARGVRREYFMAPPHLYRRGRGAFLAEMRQRPRLFNTGTYENERGELARANMSRELEQLGGWNGSG